MAGEKPERPHVFADSDAQAIHHGLLLVLSALADMKDMLVLIHKEVAGRNGA